MTIERLYDYQQEAVDRMSGQPYFLLADEMGLGKTVTGLWEVRDTAASRILIACPKSVIGVWEEHIEDMFRDKPYRVTNSMYQGMAYGDPHFVVTNYEHIRDNPLRFMEMYWDYGILDEVHYIKNRNAKRTKAVKRLRVDQKRGMSGTPMVNRPDELWSVLNWLAPKEWRSYWRYFEHFVKYWQHPKLGYKKVLGPQNEVELKALLKPFMLRRLKQDVLKDLPPKYYTDIVVDLTPEQQRVYDEMKEESLAWVGANQDEPIPAPVVVARLTRLRQFAAAYADVDYDDETGRVFVRSMEPSAKLDALMEIIQSTDQQVVVYTQFKGVIRLAEQRLASAGIPFVTLTGDTPQGKRRDVVDRFQAGAARIFLGTVGAGGVGITLHGASTVVFVDRSWSPADNLQAEDRLHRIGQRSAVQVISIKARNTVDKVVDDKINLKWSWIRSILE